MMIMIVIMMTMIVVMTILLMMMMHTKHNIYVYQTVFILVKVYNTISKQLIMGIITMGISSKNCHYVVVMI
jgi:hypothetical protein